MLNLDFEKLPSDQLGATVVTIGNFDGVHAGHQELIRKAVRDSKQKKLKSVVVTFHPHPAIYFQPEIVTSPICSKKYKEQLINALGVDAILTLSFNEKLANLSPEEYVKNILLEKLNAKVIWIGYDFSFGKNRSGHARLLIELGEKYGFQTNVLEPQRIEQMVVSSTRIREFIAKGWVEQAAKFLNRKHLIHGVVVTGDTKGRKIGFPTVNIDVRDGLVPANGIYSSIALIKDIEYPAAVYIGCRPTFNGGESRVEAHLLDFSDNLYGRSISVAFLKFTRAEFKFNNSEKLRKKIKQDCETAQYDFKEFKLNNRGIPVIWEENFSLIKK